MGTDVRKHTVPLAGEQPRRQAINDLSRSINDVIPIANATERAQLVTDLGGAYAGLTVFRQDLLWEEKYVDGAWVVTAGRLPYMSLGRNTVASPAQNVDSTLGGWTSTTGWQCTESGGSITVPVSGRYQVTAGGAWLANATGVRRIQITKNGTSFVLATDTRPSIAGTDLGQSASRTVSLAAGESVLMRIYQTSGGTLDFGTTSGRPYFEVQYIAPS